MADRSDDYGASDDDDGASQEEMPFEEVFSQMLGIIANHEKEMRRSSEIREIVILAVPNQQGGRLTLAKEGIDQCSYPVGVVGLSPAEAECNGRPFVVGEAPQSVVAWS
jgi:hypothetical protein